MAIAFLLNPGGKKVVMRRMARRRSNRGTSAGVRKSWATRKARYGDSGDSAAVKVLHGLGITGLSAAKSRGGAKAKARKLVRRRAASLPAYWKRLLGTSKAKRKPAKKKRKNPSYGARMRKYEAREARFAIGRLGRLTKGALLESYTKPLGKIDRLFYASRSVKKSPVRRKNAFFAFPEAHSKDALVKWGNRHWPNIVLYKLIKQYGIKHGQLEYARYCREHGISPRRRGSTRGGQLPSARKAGGGLKPASPQKEQGMARKRRRKNASRRRSHRSASAPKRRRRAARSNPTRRRRARRAAPRRRARRRNPPILMQTNPRKRRRRRSARRRNPPILMQTNPTRRKSRRRRSRGRRRNPPILMQTNPRKRRKSRRRGRRSARRSNPSPRRAKRRGGRRRASRRSGGFRRNPSGGIVARLMDAIPTLSDVVNVGIMSATGLFNRIFAGPIFNKLGLKATFDKVPYADRSVLTVVETVIAGFFGGRRAAQMVMYGGLTSILTGVIGDKVLAAGMLGDQTKQAALNAGFGGPMQLADYVTYGGGGRQLPNRMHDFVTMDGYEDGNEALECSPGTLETEGLSDYYGVTAF